LTRFFRANRYSEGMLRSKSFQAAPVPRRCETVHGRGDEFHNLPGTQPRRSMSLS
jgi:hypothetical protein